MELGLWLTYFLRQLCSPLFFVQGGLHSQEHPLQTYTVHLSSVFGHPFLHLPPPLFNLTPSSLLLSILFHLSLQCCAHCNLLCLGPVLGSSLFLTVCFPGQQHCTLKYWSFLLEHRWSKRFQPQLSAYSITAGFLLLKQKIALERESHPTKWWALSSSAEWFSSTRNACSVLQLAAGAPHGLFVCYGECDSSSWFSGRLFRQKHTQAWWGLLQATVALALSLTPCCCKHLLTEKGQGTWSAHLWEGDTRSRIHDLKKLSSVITEIWACSAPKHFHIMKHIFCSLN